jgi:hypothetical protein
MLRVMLLKKGTTHPKPNPFSSMQLFLPRFILPYHTLYKRPATNLSSEKSSLGATSSLPYAAN